jgi:hypothetical protein
VDLDFQDKARERGKGKDRGSEVDQEDQEDQDREVHHHISTGGIGMGDIQGEIHIDLDLGVCLDLMAVQL